MNYYKMLENLHVISNNKDRADMNFWAEELYSASDFSDACLDVRLLLKRGFVCVFNGRNKIENE